MLNTAVKVKKDSVIQGSGLVADSPIPAGEVLFQFDDTKPPVHFHERINWTRERRNWFSTFAIQIGTDDWCFQQGDIRYINHSCDPSGWWESYGILTARRDIAPGDEITYDYSTSDIRLHYKLTCLCGNDSCRGTVTERDYLKPDFQEKYAGHLPRHVVEAIDRAKANEPETYIDDTQPIPEQVVEAVRQTRSRATEFQRKYGNHYIFEMIRYAIGEIQSGKPDARSECVHNGKYEDKYIFELVRHLMLKG